MDRKKLVEKIIQISYKNKEGHIPSSLSILDILHYLYFNRLQENDLFVLSKGHGCLALYLMFYLKGWITEAELFSFCQYNSKLGGHPSSKKLPDEILLSTGSLGHGLPFCVGLALAKKIKKEQGNVYCLIGDGEANEGTTWESALIASTYKLDNLYCLIDFNKSGERAIQLNECYSKFSFFGWETSSNNGHFFIDDTFYNIDYWLTNKPKFIQFNTIKGYGCKIIENNPEWHHKYPKDEKELQQLLDEVY